MDMSGGMVVIAVVMMAAMVVGMGGMLWAGLRRRWGRRDDD